ncbi:MAG: hypothetical protein MUE58_03760 [Chitinophagaceae bacterium]|jgi:hypothetical protein|nr:hypothetical protein [Chitinophagaceae bacterium]
MRTGTTGFIPSPTFNIANMDTRQIQTTLFNTIRENQAAGESFPEKIAGLLDISTDSAYRRIRGEKELSYSEICTLCRQMNLSLDQFLGLGDGQVLFSGNFIEEGIFEFTDYLKEIRDTLSLIEHVNPKQLIYQNKDISVFYYFMFPDLLAFKYYIWMKQHFAFKSFSQREFSFDLLNTEQRELLNEINRLFIGIPSVEIMNPDNVLTDLRQIEYFKLTGGFGSADDMERVYKSLENLVDHLEMQAASGRKWLPGESPDSASQPITVYVHDFHHGDNEAVMLVNDQIISVLTHTSINFMRTTDRQMGEYSYQFMQNIIRKSSLISGAGEKFRTRFFNLIRERIQLFRSNQVMSLQR